jgi:hypothetical protein
MVEQEIEEEEEKRPRRKKKLRSKSKGGKRPIATLMKIWRVRAWAVQAWPRISYYFKASVDMRYQASHEFYEQLLDTIQGNLENWTRDTIQADLTNILEEDTIFFSLDAGPTPTR